MGIVIIHNMILLTLFNVTPYFYVHRYIAHVYVKLKWSPDIILILISDVNESKLVILNYEAIHNIL